MQYMHTNLQMISPKYKMNEKSITDLWPASKSVNL